MTDMQQTLTFSSTLDYNKALPVTLLYDRKISCWTCHIALSQVSKPRFVHHIMTMLCLASAQTTCFFQQDDDRLTATIAGNAECILQMHGKPLLSVAAADDKIRQTSPECNKLTVFETRMLGQYPHGCLPYPRDVLASLPDTVRLTTDLHTHLSSQISAEGLLLAAANADAYYPLELLHHIGLACDLPLYPMESTFFAPAASEGLACEQSGRQVDGVKVADIMADPSLAEKLAASMAIPVEDTLTFDGLERRIYRMRNPLAKNPAVITESIINVARDYAAQGVKYAELAVTAALKADWLQAASAAIATAEQQTGVALRLLIGVPRSLSPIDALLQLAKVTFIAQHPYVVGVDFLGYEANKTRNFGWALSHMARHAASQAKGQDRSGYGWHFNDDFIIRVHAGENGKNPDNVAEVLQIAKRYGVRVRVGHAAYGDVLQNVELARELAQQGLLIIEFNPDSNMAMNNIDEAAQLPVKAWADAGIPFVIASDGAGIYQTSHAQLLAASCFAGLDSADIAQLQQTEAQHIERQHAIYQKKRQAYDKLYGNDIGFLHAYSQQCERIRNDYSMQKLESKTPLLIAGASGSSWARISGEHQREITIGIHMLVALLDPAHTYFALGRVKDEGLGAILDAALDSYQRHYPARPLFDVVGMLSQHQNMPSLAHNINHIVPLGGELMSVPSEMTDLLIEKQGCALYIGGSAFTRDFIKCSEDKSLPFGVMHKVSGASSQKARVLADEHVFYGAIGMVRHVMLMKGTRLFRADADLSDEGLQHYYASHNIL